ncbi:NUDIX domain-containing protein [Micromonospora rubida]
MPSECRDVTADLPRKRMAAGLLITDADERVLLVEPVYKAEWEIPGGCVEADESPHQAAIRECREGPAGTAAAGPPDRRGAARPR